jgi:CubicO group peptidase (beta-lactamase class C family)
MNSTSANPDDIANNRNKAVGKLFGLNSLPYKVPYIGAGGIYTNTEDLAKFVQFHLNFGKVGNNQLLDVKYLYEMYSPFIVNNYALGINIGLNNDSYSLFHNGSGYGFGSSMKWYPEYGISCIVLGNYQIECVLENYATRTLNDYIIGNKLKKTQLQVHSRL